VNKVLNILVGSLCLVVLWHGTCAVLQLPEWLFPKPAAVGVAFAQRPLYFLSATGATLAASALGFLAAAVFAACVSIVFFLVPTADRLLMPYITGFKAVPLVAIAPLLVLWCGTGLVSRSIMAATICFFPLVVGFQRGFRSCSEEEVLFLRSLNLSRLRELTAYRVLRGAPFWLAGSKLSAVLAPVGAIVAEYSTANRGIGYVILESSVRNDAKRLVVGVILAALSGILLYAVAAYCEKLILRRLHLQAVDEI
jgi:NitT/TauT family transport system permease protein